ncbi:MAG TPA: GntR family transcriptional regulator [Cyclobacteriaceae bacterium]|nr:GntR family transcriptional regulator [Cyclobacteriaceae bacterium]
MQFNNDRSIFLQIADSITDKVVSGVYPTGDKIPSVRELAAEMGVNPNTIMRTYNELQSMNIIDNKRGIGYFVNPQAPKIILDQKRKTFFDKVLPEFIHQAGLLGITASDLRSHLDQLNNHSHENQ